MAETMLSVGLDVGTTSTQLVLSRLTAENRAGSFAVPELAITSREILYRSPVYFTPLLSETRMDGEKIRQIVEREYAAAGIDRAQVDTGAIIVTGESSRKENAGAVLEALSGLAGEFVAAAAGPDLESVLAAKGSGAVEYSRKTGKTVLHMDIGGGTANLALLNAGEIAATGCLNIGGRLIKRDNGGKITYVSPVLAGISPFSPGDVPGETEISALAQTLAQVLEMAAGLRPPTPMLPRLTTAGTAQLPLPGSVEGITLSFSGGVADCMAQSPPANAYGDMGPALGRAIRKSRLCQGDYLLGEETIRATVIGAGCHSAALSGSTVFCRNMDLPIKNIPVLPVRKVPEKIPTDQILYFPGTVAADYPGLTALADQLAAGSPEQVMICLEQDAAKALGQALAGRLPPGAGILCLDRIFLPAGSYLDVAQPIGPAFPVVVKTLILQQEGST